MEQETPIEIQSLLQTASVAGTFVAEIRGARRQRLNLARDEILLDEFGQGGARCLFWRSRCPGEVRLRLRGGYRMTTTQAGGWLLLAREDRRPDYWLPSPPTERRIDEQGRIFEENACPISSLQVGENGVEVGLSPTAGNVLDLVIWEIDAAANDLISELDRLNVCERQPIFLWGSHGIYRAPADLYRNLVQGSILDLRYAWPHKRRAFSENEAHALHMTLRSREIQSGKALYRRLRDQVLLSVIARQDRDGAWRHGIWTADLECHFRLHCSAMHMLMDCYCERPDPAVLAALEQAATFIAAQAAEVMGDTWFLHDSLEQSEERIRPNMPGWFPCSNPAKSKSNTLVLNTHIDTLIALHRFGSITGSELFDEQVSSARRLLKRVISAKPAELRYRLLMRPLYLTLLPTERARALALPKRALKRLARERFIPLLARLKCRAPRFAMPEGYLDRVLGIRGFADAYHSINFMDLVRYRRAYPEDTALDEPIDGAIAFANRYDLLQHWSELAGKRYAIGFWVEGLYQLYLLRGGFDLVGLLAQGAIFAEQKGLGLPPSLAGNNLELMPLDAQQICPAPPDERLRIINLSRDGRREYLIVNPGDGDVIPDNWDSSLSRYEWTNNDGEPATAGGPPHRIATGDWVLCKEPTTENAPERAGP